jgi:parallel beta-helix repeat protein
MFIRGDVGVPENLTLHITAGTEIDIAHDWDCMASGRADSLCELIVEGALLSSGGTLNRVTFAPDVLPSANLPDWYGITFEPGSTCSLASTDISGAYKSLWAMSPDVLDVRDSRFLSQSMMGVHLEGCETPDALVDCTVEDARVGIRADSCAVQMEGNIVTGASQYGIRLYDDRGSTVIANEISAGFGGLSLGIPSGIYCSNRFGATAISIDNNIVSMGDDDGEGICVYAVPAASPSLDDNEITGAGVDTGSSKGIRLAKTPAVARRNRLSDFNYHFYVECEPGQIPDLGDTTDHGYNAADDNALYNIYAVAKPPIDPLHAQMNWWGTTDPTARKFVGVGIDIEWEPCLAYDPSTRGDEQDTGHAPFGHRLDQNRPNPFNPTTVIRYAVPKESRVRIAVYDLDGRLVRVLVEEVRPPGEHSTAWDGRNQNDLPVGSGVYFCRMDAGPFSETRKLVVLK